MTASTFYSYSMLNPKVVNDLLPYRVNMYPYPFVQKKMKRIKKGGKYKQWYRNVAELKYVSHEDDNRLPGDGVSNCFTT
jgi:hypothetical protein